MEGDQNSTVDVLWRSVNEQCPLPQQAHPGDAGFDLSSAVSLTLGPGERALVPTGLAIALPTGWVGLVCPRSGMAAKHGVTVLNGPGVVDAGYRGEIKVSLINLDRHDTFRINPGDRIAQLLVQAVPQVRWHQVDSLPGSARGAAGHGSTGGYLNDNTGHRDLKGAKRGSI